MSQAKYYISIRAEVVKDLNGVVELAIEARQLTDAELEKLHDLFPHLFEQAHELLAKEALIAALVRR